MSDQAPTVLPETTTPPPLPNTVFRGPNGIRAGWRVLIFLAIMAVLAIVLGFAAQLLGRSGRSPRMSTLTPLGVSFLEATILILTVIPALIMAMIEHRKFGDYGLPARFAFRQDF